MLGISPRGYGQLCGFLVLILSIVFSASVRAVQGVSASWERNSESGVVGYRTYQGTVSHSYSGSVDVGNATNVIFSGLVEGVTYFFSVTTYDIFGVESDHSEEVAYTVPSNPSSNDPPTIAMTSPATGASYTAPATISLAASVTANGHTITKVQFYNGAILLGEDTSAPYGFTWGNVATGNYSLTARTLYDAGSTAASPQVTIAVTTTTTNLPAPWQTADIGNVGMAGSATLSSGIFTVRGAGNISGTADNFRFVYQTLTGDGEIVARLSSSENTGPNGAIGVMMRESLTSGSRYDFMGILPDRRLRLQRRATTSGTTSTYTGSGAVPTNYWVRLVRTGNMVYKWSSTDGANWSQADYNSLAMATSIQIGLVVASGSTNILNTSTFANVTVVP
jgi:hypothetical protein